MAEMINQMIGFDNIFENFGDIFKKQPKEVQEKIENIDIYIKNKQNKIARQETEKIMNEKKSNEIRFLCYVILSKIEYNEGNYKQAIEQLEQAIKKTDSKFKEIALKQIQYAIEIEISSDYEKIENKVNILEKEIQKLEKNDRYHSLYSNLCVVRAFIFIEKEEFEKAVVSCQNAIKHIEKMKDIDYDLLFNINFLIAQVLEDELQDYWTANLYYVNANELLEKISINEIELKTFEKKRDAFYIKNNDDELLEILGIL